jgi:lysophospholipase L1-like esterase
MGNTMRRFNRWLVAVLGATVLTAAAGVVATSASAESNGGVRVMPLGDSITDGFNVPGGYRIGLWQRLVAGGFSVDFVGTGFNGPANLGDHDHEGHSGFRIDQIDASIVGWLQTTTPRTVLLHIGTNDILQNVDLPNAPNRLSALIDHITATVPAADVFVATIVPISGRDADVRTFNGAIPGIVQAKVNAGRHVHLVNMFPALTTTDLADGVHPTAGGYDKMAAVWFDALRAVPGSIGATGTSAPPTSPSSRSASPSARPTTTGPGGTRTCSAAYSIVNQWPDGFQGAVRVTAGSAGTTGWTVTWTFANGQAISQFWSSTVTSNGAAITARNVSYNGSLTGGASTEFGFIASWNNSANGVPAVACAAV